MSNEIENKWREEFENSSFFGIHEWLRDRDPSGEYHNEYVEYTWQGFLAGRKHSEAEILNLKENQNFALVNLNKQLKEIQKLKSLIATARPWAEIYRSSIGSLFRESEKYKQVEQWLEDTKALEGE